MASGEERIPLSTRMLARVLDHRKNLDYLWLTVFAALPIAVALGIGAYGTVDGFVGYGERTNFTMLVVLLPAAALLLRLIAKRIAAVSTHDVPADAAAVDRAG